MDIEGSKQRSAFVSFCSNFYPMLSGEMTFLKTNVQMSYVYAYIGSVDEWNRNRIGFVVVDSADVLDMWQKGTLNALSEHEIGHVLGIGLSKTWNSLIDRTGNYIGSNGVLANVKIGGSSGQPGGIRLTQDKKHWEESVYQSELMTPNSKDLPYQPLSPLSLWSLVDCKFPPKFV